MRFLPEPIKRLVDHFDNLPGIGPKHATKLVLHLLSNRSQAAEFAKNLTEAAEAIRFCEQCFNLSDAPLCAFCRDTDRDRTTICVVAHLQDIEPIERTGVYRGVYHVLQGTINPIEGVTPEHLRTKELIVRVHKQTIKEVILAFDATMEGEATALYLIKALHESPAKLSKLARGIPVGSNIEYTDEVTLSSALENRKTM